MLKGIHFIHKIKEYLAYQFAIHDSSEAYLNLGEGMQLYENGARKVLINLHTKEEFELVGNSGNLIHITKEDIDFERVNKLENAHNAERLMAFYYFAVEPFSSGVGMIAWTLYPDGRYFEDEDGFGGRNNDETTVYAFIDTHGKILIPFRDMEKNEFSIWRKKAEQSLVGNPQLLRDIRS